LQVYCIFTDKYWTPSTTYTLDNGLRNDFEKGRTDTFSLENKDNQMPIKDSIIAIEIWREGCLFVGSWYVDSVTVQLGGGPMNIFPINRWMPPCGERLKLCEYDSVLPQYDVNADQRKKENKLSQQKYKLLQRFEHTPPLVSASKWSINDGMIVTCVFLWLPK
jgi:hypothetical protein